jgi:AcrR family transcriptional regulator
VPAASSGLRADAERNRAAVLAAAREVFSERGLDAPLDLIARRAGVGNATLYRRFASRRALLIAVFADRMADYADAAERALGDPDPWSGFAGYIRHVCLTQAEDRALADLVTTAGDSGNDELDELRARAYASFQRLIERAKDAGALRADFTAEDLVVLLMANGGLVERTGAHAPAATARLVSMLLDGLRAEAATAPAAPPVEEHIILEAMRRRTASSACEL